MAIVHCNRDQGGPIESPPSEVIERSRALLFYRRQDGLQSNFLAR
jgi:hypothetical protein